MMRTTMARTRRGRSRQMAPEPARARRRRSSRAAERVCNHHGMAECDAHTLDSSLDPHAVEAEARRLRQIGRCHAVVREPVRPVVCPVQVVQQQPAMQVARLARGRSRASRNDGLQTGSSVSSNSISECSVSATSSVTAIQTSKSRRSGSTPRWSVSNSMAISGWEALKSANRGISNLSATTSTATSFRSRPVGWSRRRSATVAELREDALDILQIALAPRVRRTPRAWRDYDLCS